MHEWSRTRHKAGKLKGPIILCKALVGATVGVEGLRWKGQSRVNAFLALDNMEEAQFVFCLLNSLVQGLFSSRKFTQSHDYTEQKFRLHQYWISSDDDTIVSAILD